MLITFLQYFGVCLNAQKLRRIRKREEILQIRNMVINIPDAVKMTRSCGIGKSMTHS